MPGLPHDWKPPARAQLEKAWDEHPEVELLNQLKAERDENNWPRWFASQEAEEDNPTWTAVWLRPEDPRDPRGPGIRITRYPTSWATEQLDRARAIADEHADD